MRGSQGGGERKERQREPPGIIVPSGCFETAAAAADAGNAAALGACQHYQAPSLAGCPCPDPWALRPHPALPRTCQRAPCSQLTAWEAHRLRPGATTVPLSVMLSGGGHPGSAAAVPAMPPAADARPGARGGGGERAEEKHTTPSCQDAVNNSCRVRQDTGRVAGTLRARRCRAARGARSPRALRDRWLCPALMQRHVHWDGAGWRSGAEVREGSQGQG